MSCVVLCVVGLCCGVLCCVVLCSVVLYVVLCRVLLVCVAFTNVCGNMHPAPSLGLGRSRADAEGVVQCLAEGRVVPLCYVLLSFVMLSCVVSVGVNGVGQQHASGTEPGARALWGWRPRD